MISAPTSNHLRGAAMNSNLIPICKEHTQINGSDNIHDISVSINKTAVRKSNPEFPFSVVFRFYYGNVKKITSTDYVKLFYDPEEMHVYFTESNSVEGYKANLSPKSTKNTQYVSVAGAKFPVDFHDYAGRYDLLYSKTEKMYFIDLKKCIK